MGPLSAAFLETVREPARSRAAASSALEVELASLVERAAAGRAHWVEAPHFVRYLAERVDPARDPFEELHAMHAADLYLACACTMHVRAALRELDTFYFPSVLAVVERSEARELSDEVQQVLRERLLVGVGATRPRIVDYDGLGPLKAWLRTVGMREAKEMQRTAMRQRRFDAVKAEETALLRSTTREDPEVALAQAELRKELQDAFAEALKSLDAPERNVLRLSIIDGLTVDELGAALRVHRATAARQLSRARELLIRRTRSKLKDQLKLSGGELESMLRAVRSQADVSIRRFFSKRR